MKYHKISEKFRNRIDRTARLLLENPITEGVDRAEVIERMMKFKEGVMALDGVRVAWDFIREHWLELAEERYPFLSRKLCIHCYY